MTLVVLLAVAENSERLLKGVSRLVLGRRGQEPVIRPAEVDGAEAILLFLGTDQEPTRLKIIDRVAFLMCGGLLVALSTRWREVPAHPSVASDSRLSASAILFGLWLGEV